ncbi:MAG: hypothetical protein PHO23_00335 [Candidatus Pacebacteria bacterium]|nr:hypothetical protein [Candidatus Paceibacterota bacterium]
MNFKKIKAITLVELLIYIALSIIVSLILLQATNLILNKKNINDEIKENVESIEARKASALLSQYVKKPITAIPPFINLPPSPPNTDPSISIPIFNP